jgi:hypothetical protein
MARVIRDIVGSSLSINDDFRNDSATRRVWVKLESSDGGNTTRMGVAISKAVEFQNEHPESSCTAPLRKAEAKQVGSDTFEVSLTYYHEAAKFQGTEQLFSMRPTQKNKEKVWVYRRPWDSTDTENKYSATTGLPTGDLLFNVNDEYEVAHGKAREWFPPQFDMAINGKINAGLAASLAPMFGAAGSVNNADFVYGGMTFPENSLRFEDVAVDYVREDSQTSGGLFYYLTYNFRYIPNGLYTHAISRNRNPNGTLNLIEDAKSPFGPRVSFKNLFPGTGAIGQR